ncbi:MAG: type I glutamate--ammonia ligase, partial [Anaerolineaceae bacterium]
IPEPLNDINIYDLTSSERKELGIEDLPGSLIKALDELEKDTILKDTLGREVYESFRRAKLEEWEAFRICVTDWEIERYMESV